MTETLLSTLDDRILSPDPDEEPKVRDFFQRLLRGEGGGSGSQFWNNSGVELKLYQTEEVAKIFELIATYLNTPEQEIFDIANVVRFRRFFAALTGFYEGSLDLTGRHESRYARLLKRFLPLSKDVFKFAALCVIQYEENGVESEDELTELYFELGKKWNAEAIPAISLVRSCLSIDAFLKSNKKPIFQNLLLLDLPPELLHEIMIFSGPERSRRLGSTCKALRAVSLPFIYKERIFDIPFAIFQQADNAYPGSRSDTELANFRKARDALIEDLDFISSRPDIHKHYKYLNLFHDRYQYIRELLAFEAGSEGYVDFFGPVEAKAQTLLELAINLEDLCISNLVVTKGIGQAVISLNQLQRLRIQYCDFTDSELEALSLPPCPSVRTVVIDIISDENNHNYLWNFLSSFPSITFLVINVSTTFRTQSLFAGLNVETGFNPFKTLERLILYGLFPLDISQLSEKLREAGPLSLTHFKIQANNNGTGIPAWFMVRILDALQKAPMRILSLEGIKIAQPILISVISHFFPDLEALTILFRDSERQTETKEVRWPCPSWEYAYRLSQLHHLKFFGWNCLLPTLPQGAFDTFKSFEDGFPESPTEFSEENDDEGSTIRLFAAYCPTLEYFTIFRHRSDPGMSFNEYTISHTANGRIESDAQKSLYRKTIEYCPDATSEWHHWEVTNLPMFYDFHDPVESWTA